MTVDPSRLRIDVYPTETLRAKADPVEPGGEVRDVAQRMIELMHGADGIGLAAPQVGLPWRLFVAHVPPPQTGDAPGDPPPDPPAWTDEPGIFLNPEIIDHSDDLALAEEGCLSLPGIQGDVRRPSMVTMRAITPDGHTVELAARGLLARCWQHEIDHLDGVLIIDKMSQLSRTKNRSRIRSLERAGAR